MAYRLISPELIAINLELEESDFTEELRNPKSEVRKAFYKGYILQLIETRDALIKSARNGSNPSIDNMLRFFHKINNVL
jgi:hypothetical protein